MKIGIQTFENQHGRKDIGSSRIRGYWLVKYWEDAEIFVQGKDYDAVIYQKAYWIEHAKHFDGFKILDLCDPDFLHWQYKTVEMIKECDVVTTSSEALRDSIKNFTDKPVIYIPDRMDLEFHKQKKIHTDKAKTVVWFGYSDNFEMLKPTIPHLVKLKLDLIVISNKGFLLPAQFIGKIQVTNYPWSLETVNDDIVRGDILINPQSEKGKWKYKSNNKTTTGYLLNMPVAQNIADLKRFIDPVERNKEAKEKLEIATREYDVKKSVIEYKKIIEELNR